MTGRLPVRLGVQMFTFSMSSLCQPSVHWKRKVCSLTQSCSRWGQLAP